MRRLPVFWSLCLMVPTLASYAQEQPPKEKKLAAELIIQNGQRNELSQAVAISPDGKTLAAGGSFLTSAIYVWDTATGRLIRKLPGHGGYVTGLTFNRDGKWLVSVGNDTNIRFWDTQSGELLRTLEAGDRFVYGPVFLDDDKMLVSFESRATRIWDLSTNKQILAIKEFGSSRGALLDPQKKWIITGGHGNSVRTYEMPSGTPMGFRFLQHNHWINSMFMTRDATKVLTGSEDKHVRLWDLNSNKELIKIPVNATVKAVAFSKDETKAYSASTDGFIKLWDLKTGKELLSIKHGNSIESMSLTADYKKIATVSSDGIPHIWDAETGKVLQTFKAYCDPVHSIALSGDEKWLVCSRSNGISHLWNLEQGQQSATFVGKAETTQTNAISHDGKIIVTANNEGVAQLWDPKTGKELRSFTGHKGKIYSVSLSPDNKTFITGGEDGTVRIYDIAKGEEIHNFASGKKFIKSACFTADGKRFLASGTTNKIDLWDIQTGKIIREYAGYDLIGDYPTQTLSADNKWLVGGWSPYLWNFETGERIHMYYGGNHVMNTSCISADGKWVVGGCRDGKAYLWDVNNEKPPIRSFDHTNQITGVALTRDGKRLFTSSLDNTVRLWEVATGKELCKIVNFITGDWVVTDTDGRFDASNEGDVPGIHWSINGKVYNLKQLPTKYRDPGLLSKKLGTNKAPLSEVEPIPTNGLE